MRRLLRRWASVIVVLSTAVAGVAAAYDEHLPPGAAASGPGGMQVEVSGTVQVVAGERGAPDQHYLETDSGLMLRLAAGFRAAPLSRVSATVSLVPGAEGVPGALRRASAAGDPVRLVDAVVAPHVASPRPRVHRTYAAVAENLGALSAPLPDVLERVGQAQAYWTTESRGRITAWEAPTTVSRFNVSATSVADGCGLVEDDFFETVREAGREAFRGVDFSGREPNHLVVVVPGSCVWGGVVGRAALGVGLASGGPVIVSSEEYQPHMTKFTSAR